MLPPVFDVTPFYGTGLTSRIRNTALQSVSYFKVVLYVLYQILNIVCKEFLLLSIADGPGPYGVIPLTNWI